MAQSSHGQRVSHTEIRATALVDSAGRSQWDFFLAPYGGCSHGNGQLGSRAHRTHDGVVAGRFVAVPGTMPGRKSNRLRSRKRRLGIVAGLANISYPNLDR